MTAQELLILSFFDKTIPKKLDNKTLTTEMIEVGIGCDEAANFPYYKLVLQLRKGDLLILYKDPSKTQKGIVRAIGPELLVLSDKAVQILQRNEEKRIHEAFVTEPEFNKLKTEHDLLARQLADYTKTKRQAFWAILISIISVLVAIFSLKLKN
ncbi:MAG: hypothetical protein M3R72_11060 [Bacteroidota bacterium]|nr:hypothetical protein [Bacteroidota bacterium]